MSAQLSFSYMCLFRCHYKFCPRTPLALAKGYQIEVIGKASYICQTPYTHFSKMTFFASSMDEHYSCSSVNGLNHCAGMYFLNNYVLIKHLITSCDVHN
jgi:hypothetical protein